MCVNRLQWLLLPCVLWLALSVQAAPVEYGTQGGGGTMRLDRARRGVSIDVLGVNAHSCSVRGRLTGAQLDRVEAPEACSFQLQSKAHGVFAVIVDDAARDACRGFCGARAWFEGDYLPLPAACTQTGLSNRQREALKAYHGKRFDDAFRLWSQGLAGCEKTMSWPDVWRWRNDAAIAAAHAGHAADCTRLSQAVLADAKRFTLDGETEPFTFAPSDADTARPLISAARHNLGRCDAKT
jgi:hypothetical protein